MLEILSDKASGALGSDPACSALTRLLDLNRPQITIYKMRSVIFVFPILQSYCEDKIEKQM